MNASPQKIITLAIGCVAALGCLKVDEPLSEIHEKLPWRIGALHLPNAIRIHERIVVGGQPDGEAGFRELQALAVKTIISVDGAKPNLDLAAKFRMRYVHLPHGYNGISDERTAQLAKVVRDFEGPIYIHCHHGKHRSPTAAAVACVANGMMEAHATTPLLKFAGTSESYLGLYQSAANARRLDNQLLDSLDANFPEVVELPPFAEAMVQLELTFDYLKRLASVEWKSLDGHPDLDPAHEALLLSEHFSELLRLDSVANEPTDFRKMLEQSDTDARLLETLLRDRITNTIIRSTEINKAFQRLSTNCAACHKLYRDVPLGR